MRFTNTVSPTVLAVIWINKVNQYEHTLNPHYQLRAHGLRARLEQQMGWHAFSKHNEKETLFVAWGACEIRPNDLIMLFLF